MKTNLTLNELKNRTGVSVVDMNATWCGPCRMLKPVLEKLEGEYNDVEFYGVDVDDNPEFAEEFGVSSIPCVILVKDGKEVARSVGFKPFDQMKNFVDQYK
ncbi:MAG: thioredoxin [Acholeplasmatales bacterium]|nr:thioredoxin [Acholeplasmatales bacterium]